MQRCPFLHRRISRWLKGGFDHLLLESALRVAMRDALRDCLLASPCPWSLALASGMASARQRSQGQAKAIRLLLAFTPPLFDCIMISTL